MFDRGEKPVKFSTFNGEVYLTNVVTGENEAKSPGMHYVVFSKGIYNAWHSHEGGQILIVTDGTGYHQIKGGKVEEIHVGDVALCARDTTHWNGGSLFGTFAHIALNTSADKSGVTWYEMMSEEDYRKITQEECSYDDSNSFR